MNVTKLPQRPTRATPKSLIEALLHGADGLGNSWSTPEKIELAQMMEPYVRDFLAQRFGAALLQSEEAGQTAAIEELYFLVTGRRAGQ